MDTGLLPAAATPLDLVSALVSTALYLIVAAAAAARAPRDSRVRLFLAIAVASIAPYSVTALLWARGAGSTFTFPVMAMVALSLMIGSLTLFHFSQIFPWRRPWIRQHWRWLAAAYLLAPVAVGLPAWMFRGVASVMADEAGGFGAVSFGLPETLTLLVVVMPVLFLVGIVTPFAAVLSLYKTWLTARAAGTTGARVTTFWILISQMAGGVLTILIIPLLHLVAPSGPWATIAGLLLFAGGLLMPAAFAAGVWKFGVLDLDIDALPAPKPS